jgi:hypothetical protein
VERRGALLGGGVQRLGRDVSAGIAIREQRRASVLLGDDDRERRRLRGNADANCGDITTSSRPTSSRNRSASSRPACDRSRNVWWSSPSRSGDSD